MSQLAAEDMFTGIKTRLIHQIKLEKLLYAWRRGPLEVV